MHLFHVLGEREVDGNGFMWYKLWEQWNSGIATPSPRPVPRLNLSVPWLNSVASMDKQYYITWSTALCESVSVEIISTGTPD